MAFAIKAEVNDPHAQAFAFTLQKTMYGGKHVAAGDTMFIFASGKHAGHGLIVQAIVTSAEAKAKQAGVPRQTPRISLSLRRLAVAKRCLGRSELKGFTDWSDGRPETELNFKLYRQATDKIVGLSDGATAFLAGFF